MVEASLPLEGLKVVEVASWIAAPVAATILADLGADVVKIEPPGDGDPYRGMPASPAFEDVGVNYTWIMAGRGKRSVTLNLKTETGLGILRRLVGGCDVYITNHPLPLRKRFKLTYDELAPLNPRMIYASLTAYGEVGPERDRPAFDQVAYWARSGLLDLVRATGAPPVQGLPGMGDHPTGVSLYAAILTALYRRERTGKGGLVHTSLHANGFWSNACLGQAALAGVKFADRRERADRPQMATHVLYEARDGRYVQLNMVRTEEQVAALFRILGLTHLLQEPRFATPDDRFENGAALAAEMRAVFSTRPAAEWFAALHAEGVPASPVVLTEELGADEQAIANDVLLEVDDAEVGMRYVINHPIRLGDVRGRGPARPPEVGEHCDEVLAELGYSPSEIEELRREGML